MNHFLLKNARAALFSSLLVALTACTTSNPSATRRSDTTANYHGVEVADPYDWLEQMDSAETQSWIDDQNERSQTFLAGISERTAIRERLTALWDYEKIGTPWKKGKRTFQYRNNGLQNHHVLYVLDDLDAPPRVLIDPNTFSEDGTVSLASVAISDDGEWAAYALSKSGSDWRAVHVRHVGRAQDLEDHLQWIKFSTPSWDRAGKGFYYGRYHAVDADLQHKTVINQQRLYYHRIGTSQDEDVLIYENPHEPKWGYGAGETDDGQYLLLQVWKDSGGKNALFYRKRSEPDSPFIPLFDQFDARYEVVGSEGPHFWIETSLEAPRGKVIEVHLDRPSPEHWNAVIPEQPETLRGVGLVGNRFFCSYLKDAKSLVRIHAIDGALERTLPLPGIGTARGFSGEREHEETFFSFSSYATPSRIYRYDIPSATATMYAEPEVDFDSDQYTTRQVFYPSKDGTRVPMFISHKKGLALDGSNPTMLYGYGGFNASLTPRFSVTRLVWMELGGVYAVANIRGGGEYGEAWHEAGTKLNKQNVFDDFIAAAQYLVDAKITSTEKLAIAGGSNGGLLVGACLTQRPDLFGAALPSVGVMDMLKYHTYTIGWAWASDYGTVDDPNEFKALYAYSPYHNCQPAAYPPTLVTTADTDDRVIPAHSYKFTAALQQAQQGEAPVLIRVDRKAGHGGGKPTAMMIEEHVDRLAFLYKTLEMHGLE